MKILHIITNLAYGGAETNLYNLVTRMDRGRFTNSVVSLVDMDAVGARLKEAGVPVTALGMRRGVPDPLSLFRLGAMIRRERPDVIQTWLYHSDLMGTIARSLFYRGAPVFWNIRCADMVQGNRLKPLYWVMRLLAAMSRAPEAVVVNSETGRKFHQGFGYRPRRWEVIHNGFDIDRFKPRPEAGRRLKTDLGLDCGAPLVGLVTRFDPVKGIDVFISAAAMVARRFPQVRFVMAGEGMRSGNGELLKWANGVGVGGKMVLLGKRDDMPYVTAALDVAVSASISEGFSNTIGEAMACGVVNVVTDAGDSAATVDNTGFVAPPGNPEALAGAIISALAMDEGERRQLGMKARERIARHYSLAACVGRYERLYEEAVSRRERG